MPRDADKERLDHREAGNESSYLGKPHTLPGLCREGHTNHFNYLHQLMSTHKDAKYSTHPLGHVHYINVCVGVIEQVKLKVRAFTVHTRSNMLGKCAHTPHAHTISLSLPYLHVCMEAFCLLELNRLIEGGR